MNINNDNYELWLLRYAEQDLAEAERAEVERWIAAHPEAAEALSLYDEAPRLTKDERVKAPALPQRSITLWPIALRWTAAAAVVAALMMPAMRSTVAPTVEPPLIAENLENLENLERLEPLEGLEGLENQKNTPRPAPESTAPALLAESIPAEAQQPAPAEPSEEPAPETKVPAQPETVQPAYTVVDDLIVFEDETPESTSATDILADANVTYTQSTGNINPIGHFISTFIKANK